MSYSRRVVVSDFCCFVVSDCLSVVVPFFGREYSDLIDVGNKGYPGSMGLGP